MSLPRLYQRRRAPPLQGENEGREEARPEMTSSELLQSAALGPYGLLDADHLSSVNRLCGLYNLAGACGNRIGQMSALIRRTCTDS